jgi:hypothetical protein
MLTQLLAIWAACATFTAAMAIRDGRILKRRLAQPHCPSVAPMGIAATDWALPDAEVHTHVHTGETIIPEHLREMIRKADLHGSFR